MPESMTERADRIVNFVFCAEAGTRARNARGSWLRELGDPVAWKVGYLLSEAYLRS